MKKRPGRVLLEIEKPDKDEYFSARSVLYEIPNGGGAEYESNAINIRVAKDGAISFHSDDVESHIYFYPKQIPHLKKALAELQRLVRERKNK